jgi:phospholipid/cholesterol/gamma-HCH transport system permease protein
VYLNARIDSGELRVELAGDWRIGALAALETEIAALELGAPARRVRIAAAGLASLDLSGAWALRRLTERIRGAGLEVAFDGPPPEQLALLEETLREGAPVVPGRRRHALSVAELASVTALGRRTVRGWIGVLRGLEFVGRTSTMLGRALISVRRLRPTAITRHVYDTGITAIPLVSLIAFLISVIVAYMGAQQLVKFGAEIFVVDLVTIGVLREMAVLLTAIIVDNWLHPRDEETARQGD